MSVFQNLNLNQTVELSPNVIFTQTVKAKTPNKTLHRHHHFSKSQLHQYRNNDTLNDKIDKNQSSFKNPVKFDANFYHKIHENKAKIKSLLLNPTLQNNKIKRNQTNNQSNFNKGQLNLNKDQFYPNKIVFSQQLRTQILKNLSLIPKISTETKTLNKNKSSFIQSQHQFQTIVKKCIYNFDQITKFQSSKNIITQHVLWKIKSSSYFFTSDALLRNISQIINTHYSHLFLKKQKIFHFISFTLYSQQIQAYQVKQQILSQMPDISFDDIRLLLNQSQNQKQQKQLSSLIEKKILQFFMTVDIGKSSNLNQTQQVSPFNNYEYHIEPTNLSSFLPSYEEQGHFLLDKFTQTENIFDEEEKLKLLLHLSRDPYEPRSSAKYISHMSTLVDSLFGLNEQKEEEEKQSASQKQLREKQSLQVEKQLKAWQQTFGNLIVKL